MSKFMKKLFAVLAVLALAGCAYLDATHSILDIFYDDPPKIGPKCTKEEGGMVKDGQLCVRDYDGQYYWIKDYTGGTGQWRERELCPKVGARDSRGRFCMEYRDGSFRWTK